MCRAELVSQEEAIRALNRLLVGRSLVYIFFGTHFRIHFVYSGAATGKRPSPPLEVIVDILGAFWINDKGDWEKKVAEVPSSVVEPSEPVMAYELARLRWTENSEVADIFVDEDKVVFKLKNQETITFSMYSEDEFAFLATDDADVTKSKLSICCDQGAFYARGLDRLPNDR